jgi:hypothetical protein
LSEVDPIFKKKDEDSTGRIYIKETETYTLLLEVGDHVDR